MSDVEAIVIGAGCGGLSAGALLASQGRRVLVLEQSDGVGGCASSFQREGYTFDVGASIFEVLEPLRRTLAALGTTLQDELELIPCDPTVAVALRDGQRITFAASPGGIVEALAAALLRLVDARRVEAWPQAESQVAKASFSNATASRRFTGFSTASS